MAADPLKRADDIAAWNERSKADDWPPESPPHNREDLIADLAAALREARAERDEHIRMNLAADNARYKAEAERDRAMALLREVYDYYVDPASPIGAKVRTYLRGEGAALSPDEQQAMTRALFRSATKVR